MPGVIVVRTAHVVAVVCSVSALSAVSAVPTVVFMICRVVVAARDAVV
ncbi:hypothetical protein ABT063_25770 [Streptomyces sp. NPDC002838]